MMIVKLGERRGYKVFRQDTADFAGVYTTPGIGLYLGQTFEQACGVIDAHLDAQPEEDVPFDDDLAAELYSGLYGKK